MIQLIKGDITKITDVDAIVNAANSSLLGGEALTGRYTGRQDQSCFLSAVCLAAARQDRRS